MKKTHMYFGKTSARSPRANSTFKTNEKRVTYRMAEEIMDVLKREENGRYISTEKIINTAHKLGYCRPYYDRHRIASSHPYWKVLSEMTTPGSPLYVSNLVEISTENVLRYRLDK